MSDLVTFLLARLDEDEAVAKGPPGWKLEHWSAVRYKTSESGREWRVDAEPRCIVDQVAAEDAAHIVRYDPARVVRKVAAEREVIALAGEVARTETRNTVYVGEQILRHLAAVYSDHPDYDPVWKPG